MKKVAIIGCPGIGKEEFAKELSKRTGIPYYDLSEAYRIEEEDFKKNISFDERERLMTKRSTWIMSGCYSKILIQDSDVIFFLDYSRQLCHSIIKENPMRGITNGAVSRFHMNTRTEILKLLEKHSEKNIFIFKDETEKESYINGTK